MFWSLLFCGSIMCIAGTLKGPEYRALESKLQTCKGLTDRPLKKERCVQPVNMEASVDSRKMVECICPTGTTCTAEDVIYTCESSVIIKSIEKKGAEYTDGLNLKDN